MRKELEGRLKAMIVQDNIIMEALFVVGRTGLPDCWIGAGFIRNFIWDELHGYADRSKSNDIDVVYYDPEFFSEERDKRLEEYLERTYRQFPWSVKNQARMHRLHDLAPYSSTAEGVANWTETATAVAVSVSEDGQMQVLAPHGLKDLFDLWVRPTPFSRTHPELYRSRLARKKWEVRWPKLQIERI